MFRRIIQFAVMIGPLLAVSPASGDPWKDESGKGRHWKGWQEDWGETPWWGRGKGYWDGHFKHGYGGPPVYRSWSYDYVPIRPYYHHYYAPPPPPPVWYEEPLWWHEGIEELPPPSPHWHH